MPDIDYLERDALLAGPLSDLRKRLNRANQTEIAGAKPIEFITTDAEGNAGLRPYEKWKWARYPKEHLTDEFLQAVGVLAETVYKHLDTPGDPYHANGFYRECWFSKNQTALTFTINKWVQRLREAGAPL